LDRDTLVLELLQPILDAFSKRNEVKVAKRAGALTFWRDGMLRELEIIAEGKATKQTYRKLAKQLDESEGRVQATMEKLVEARHKLAGRKIADQIDKILNDYHFGKSMIRSEIRIVLSTKDKNLARHICNSIHTLNSELERLNRMVTER
jgi:hypothetical protein